MRILRSIVESLMLPVLNTRHDFSFRRAVAPQLVGDDHARHVPQTLQQLTEEALGGFLIPATLNQNVQHVAILVHGSPQVMILATDLDEYFIEVPLVARAGTSSTQLISVCLAELQAPFSDRLIGNDNATHSHNLFDIAKAQSEAEVEPHCVADDLSGETVAAIERRSSVHQPIMQHVLICGTLGSLS